MNDNLISVAKDNSIRTSAVKLNNVAKMICVGVDIETSKKSLNLANKYSSVYATCGFHPHESKDAKYNYLTQLEECLEVPAASPSQSVQVPKVSLEAEIPEALYKGMKSFISSNPKWDQYKLMSSALANFLFQNGVILVIW